MSTIFGRLILKVRYFVVFVAEGVQFIHDLAGVFERTPQPAVGGDVNILLDAVLMFVHYYEQNEHFDLLTHGIGPGLVAVIMHSFSEFMGDMMGTRLDLGLKYSGKRLFQHMYFEKLRNIANSIVVDETDKYSGKLLKRQEEKAAPAAPQASKKGKKDKKAEAAATHPEDKSDRADDRSDDEDEIQEISDDGSCSSNENDFSTLTSTHGTAYHPPSRRTAISKYAAGKSGDEAVELMEKAASKFQHKIDNQQRTIERLQSENNLAREKLKKLGRQNPEASSTSTSIVAETKKKKGKKGGRLLGFAATQILKDADLDQESDDEVMSVDVDEAKPDSTQRSVVPAESDGDESVVIPSSQMVAKKKRHRVDSDTSTKKADTPLNVSDAESEKERDVGRLLQEKLEVRNKLIETQKKLQVQLMENKSRNFKDSVTGAIVAFRSVLMECFGAPKDDPRLEAARQEFAAAIRTVSDFGYTFRVGEEFIYRVERSVYSGYTPEHQMQCKRIDNSTHCPIQGDVIDVVYEISMPVVVKQEKMEDDDCLLLMVQPAPLTGFQSVKVKEEKVDNGSPTKEPSNETKTTEDSPEKMDTQSSAGGSPSKESEEVESASKHEDDEEDDENIDVVNTQNTPATKKRKKKNKADVDAPSRNLRPRT